jgi:hypothetical protein
MRRSHQKIIARLALISALFTGGGCARSRDQASSIKATGNRIGYLRGFSRIDQIAKSRLLELEPGGFLDIGSLLEGGSFSSDLVGFRLLLGGFGPESARGAFENGAPNAVNIFLWQVVLGRLADGLAKGACDGSGSVALSFGLAAIRTDALNSLKPLCAGTHASAELQSLWTLVMGFEPPAAELDAWLAVFADKPVPLADLLRSLFLNPFFLLED